MPQLKKEDIPFVESVSKIINKIEEVATSETKCAIFCLILTEEEDGVSVFSLSTSNHPVVVSNVNSLILQSQKLSNVILGADRKEDEDA